ncbi:MAG TPA: hypothetical protein VH595_14020, partial [Verrucomicrobiae bacterium]|nr:hypothetical protein [Verrucomicrobiae bacterium]
MKTKKKKKRKLSGPAILKALPAEKQDALYRYVNGENGKNSHTYSETIKWLLETEKIEVHDSALHRFLKWYSIRKDLSEYEIVVKEIVEECKKNGWLKTAKQERLSAQIFFNRLVVNKQDPELWAVVEKINLTKDKISLDTKELEMKAKSQKLAVKSQKPETRSQ